VSPFGASLRALFGRVGFALVLCVAVIVTGVVAVNRYIDDKVDEIPRVALQTTPVPADATGMNFLIVGSDSRSFVEDQLEYNAFSDADTQDAPPRSDSMMVLHADGDRSYAVSFPRDLWVDIPGQGSAKLNAAFNNGPQPVIDTMQADFNVPINHYLEVDFETFQGIVDAVGTIPVWVPGTVRDTFSGFAAPWVGCWNLDGFDALAYVRARHLEILGSKGWTPLDATADIGRIERQQVFVKKLGRIAVERVLDDPTVAPDIVDALLPNLQADAGFDRDALNQLVLAFMGLATGDTGITFETLPWDGPATRDQQSVVLVKYPEADTVFARLRGDVPVEPTPVSTTVPATADPVRPADVSVQVLNGSGVDGAAGKADQELGNRGFVSGGIGNNPGGGAATTQIRYRTGDEAKARLVATSVPGAQLVADPTMTGGSIVLVLGGNFRGIGTAAPKDTAPLPPDPAAAEAAC
jgi:LCP family protein required for cell wall assembly